MKILAVLLVAACACFGADISGVWRLKHASADGPSYAIAVQVEQCGDNIQVLRLVSTIFGKRVEQFRLTIAAIHTLPAASEIAVGNEKWTIGASGELTIREANGQRVVLEPAEGVVE